MWLIRRINLLSVNATRAHQRISDVPGRQCGVRMQRCLDGSFWLRKSSKIQGKIRIKWWDHNILELCHTRTSVFIDAYVERWGGQEAMAVVLNMWGVHELAVMQRRDLHIR